MVRQQRTQVGIIGAGPSGLLPALSLLIKLTPLPGSGQGRGRLWIGARILAYVTGTVGQEPPDAEAGITPATASPA